MALKVFLSYSTGPEENVIVWRLQTLAAANGIQVFVPQRREKILPSSPRVLLSGQVQRAIDQADCVLAIITARTSRAVEKELNYALARNKTIIPIVEQGVADASFLGQFKPVFWFSRTTDPGKFEASVVEFLRQRSLDKDRQQAIGALVAVGIGLLLLAGATKD